MDHDRPRPRRIRIPSEDLESRQTFSASSVGQFKGAGDSLGNVNIWENAIQNSTKSNPSSSNSPSILYVLGHAQSGKTKLITSFLGTERRSNSKEIGLDFSYRLKNEPDGNTKSCHVWELCGNAVEWKSLIDLPIETTENLDKLTVVLVMDLSKPEAIWDLFHNFVTSAKEGYENAIRDMGDDEYHTMSKLLKVRKASLGMLDSNDDEVEHRDIFPLPLLMIGGKYDEFERYEPERKKHLSRVLRLLSHKLGAALCFYSSQNVQLVKRMQDLLSHYTYGTALPGGQTTDPHEPMFVMHGTDSFKAILPPDSDPAQFNFQKIMKMLEKKYGLSVYEKEKLYNPAMDPRFREPDVDHRREEELKELRHEPYARIMNEEPI